VVRISDKSGLDCRIAVTVGLYFPVFLSSMQWRLKDGKNETLIGSNGENAAGVFRAARLL
jgi:hypothetical protein